MSVLTTNLHTHTFRCHHASGTEREYIEAAIVSGIKVLGFSEHAPLVFEDGHEAHYTMNYCDVEDYFNTLKALREGYKDKIQILIGFEMEYYPKYFEENMKKLESYGVDYLILGQHMTQNGTSPYVGWYFGDPHILTCYVDDVIQGMKTGRFTYVAHPDLPLLDAGIDIFIMEMDRLCAAAAEMKVPLEFNLQGFLKRRNYPSDILLDLIKKYNNDIVFGVDAHCAEQLTDVEGFERAYKFLSEQYDLHPLDTIKVINPYV